jgi:hypothetical protein
MKPIDHNKEAACVKTSSRCVVWNGPDIPCLNLCHGDSIEDVVYKLGKAHCELAEQLNLSTLDLSCLVESCNTCPEPQKTLRIVLQLLINKVCNLQDLINDGGGNDSNGGTQTLPVVNLPACLQYASGSTTIVSLPVDEYVYLVANKVCAINSTVNSLDTRVSSLEQDVADLQAAITGAGGITQVNMTCLGSGLTDIDAAVEAIEEAFCALRGATGTASQISAAVAKQCAGLAASDKLTGTGIMSSISGWSATPVNGADAMSNLWLTVCDMRSAVSTLMITSKNSACDNFKPDFSFSYSTDRTQATLKTYGFMSIPTGWSNGTVNRFVISDGTNSYTVSVDLVALTGNSSGTLVNLTSNGIDTTKDLTVTLEANIVNGSSTCSKVSTKTIVLPCIKNPVTALTTTPGAGTIAISYTAPTGIGVPVSFYTVNVYKDVSGVYSLVSSNNITGVSTSLSGLSVGSYKVEVFPTYAGTCGAATAAIKIVTVS